MAFAERFEYILNLSKISKYRLARDLHFSHNSVLKWGRGLSEPKAWQIADICTYLDVSADYLLGLSDNYWN